MLLRVNRASGCSVDSWWDREHVWDVLEAESCITFQAIWWIHIRTLTPPSRLFKRLGAKGERRHDMREERERGDVRRVARMGTRGEWRGEEGAGSGAGMMGVVSRVRERCGEAQGRV